MKWGLELGQYGLVFRPRTTIKAQALADFIAEFAPSLDFWHLYVDNASNYKDLGAGMVFVTPDGSMLEHGITLGFKASNNEAEYEALLAASEWQKTLW
ncbi:hypothetical protein COP2_031623 [Malus domestica]